MREKLLEVLDRQVVLPHNRQYSGQLLDICESVACIPLGRHEFHGTMAFLNSLLPQAEPCGDQPQGT